MKKLFFAALILLGSITGHAQTKVTTTQDGNFRAVKDTAAAYKPAGKTYTDTQDKIYPVFVSAKGKYFIIRISKTGKEYRQYLKID